MTDRIVKHERAQQIIRAALEAGVMKDGEFTIVVVANAKGEIDISSVMPNNRAPGGLAVKTLLLALLEIYEASPQLVEVFETAKDT